MAKFSVGFVDGGKQDYEEDRTILARLLELKSQGLDGKRLIDALITDDWGRHRHTLQFVTVILKSLFPTLDT